MLRLLVKGSLGEAFHAAADHGLTGLRYLGESDCGEQIIGADLDCHNQASRWYAEPAAVIHGQGFPAGTLLYFSEASNESH